MRIFLAFLFSALLVLGGCTEAQLFSHVAKRTTGGPAQQGNFKVGNPYKVAGQWYQPQEDYELVETGIASWYGPGFHGKRTANGERFDQNELTAAHRTLQLPSLVRVTNLENGRSVIVRVNDRGPFKRGRIIDLSSRAADLLGFKGKGTAKVRLEVLSRESRAIALAAKNGQDTRGVEVAMNENGKLPGHIRTVSAPPAPTITTASAPQAIERRPVPASIQAATGHQTASLTPEPVPISREELPPLDIPGHTKNGTFYPDPVVQQQRVQPTTIFVQAGAFTVQDNARTLAQNLQSFGPAQVYPALIGGRQFYRVRIPADSVTEADRILNRLVHAGNADAIIIVE